jgi:hypothetical protein
VKHGSFLTGAAHHLATRPPFVLVELDGKPGNLPAAVGRFAWLGNQDQPGAPTAWREIAVSPEK